MVPKATFRKQCYQLLEIHTVFRDNSLFRQKNDEFRQVFQNTRYYFIEFKADSEMTKGPQLGDTKVGNTEMVVVHDPYLLNGKKFNSE